MPKIIDNQTTWEADRSKLSFSKLDQNLEADVSIVGGGITGLLGAYMLAKAGKKVVVLEAEKIISQTTAWTTAFITQSIDTNFAEMLKIYGLSRSRLILESHGRAIDLIEKIVKEEKINCEFMRCSNYSYANTEEEFDSLKREKTAADKLGFATTLKKKNDLGFNNYGYLEMKRQAKFHPIKFLQSLAERMERLGVQIYENSKVEKIAGSTVKLENGNTVKADYAIVATYYPFNNPKNTFAKKGMYKTYVFEARVGKGLLKEGIYEDLDNPYHYFRIDRMSDHDRLIIGGEDHRKEIKIPEDKNFKALEEYLKKILGDKKYTLTRKWAGPILEPSDGLALIGEYAPHQLLATAFSGNGMTYAAITAMMFRDIIAGKKNNWLKIYDPKRKPTAKQLLAKARDYGGELYNGAIKNAFKQ